MDICITDSSLFYLSKTIIPLNFITVFIEKLYYKNFVGKIQYFEINTNLECV